MNLPEAVLQQSADAIIFADRAGRIQLWNRGSEVLFGFTPAEAIGQPLDIIIPEQMRAAHNEGWQRAMAAGRLKNEGRVMTTRARGKYGNRLYVDFSFSLVTDDTGTLVGAVAIGRDVTDKWLEKQAMRALAAEGAK